MSVGDVEIHLRAYDEASDIIQNVGSNLSSTFTDIQGRTQDLVTTTDDATSQIAADYNQVGDAGQNLQNSQGDVQASCGDSVMALNNLALSGAALSMSFMNVENRQVAVDRANLMVERSTATLEKAQLSYNTAVEKYGEGSAQAQAALDKLNIAQDAHNVAVERADMSTRNLNMSMVMAALTVIPSLISMITTVSHATEIWKGIQETMNLIMDANPIFLVVAAIAGLVAVFVLAYNSCEPFRNAINTIGAYIGGAFLTAINAVRDAFSWLWNNVLVPFGTWLGTLFLNPIKAVTDAFNTLKGAIGAVGDFFGGIAGDIGNAWGGFVGIFTGGNKQAADSVKTLTSAVQDTAAPMTAAEWLTGFMTNATANFEAAVQSADKTLLESNDILVTNAATFSEYKDKATSAGDEVKAINSQIADLNKTYGQSKGALDTQLMGMQAMNTFMPGLNNNVDLLKTKEADLKTQLDTTTSSLEKDKVALEAQQKAANDAITFIDGLTKKYDDIKASADTNLGAVKSAFDAAFNAGDFDKALGIVKDFANKYGLSLSDAEKIIDSFKAAQATIPKSIEEQLIGKAQADLKTFQDCATGKFAGLHGDASTSMNQLVTDTNDLIAHGLVGQAQDNIKAYVTCASDKHAQLVSNIEADLAKLRKDYAAGASDLAPMIKQLEEFKLAATFGQPGVDIYAAIKLAGTTASDVAAQTATATTQITASFQGMANNAIVHAQRLEDSLVGHSLWTDMLRKMEDTTEKSVAKIHKQFQSLQAEGIAGGGFGISETLPGAGGRAPVVHNWHIDRLVNIEGSADRATVDYATKQVLAQLKTVIVEPTSASAPATAKRIRQGAVFT